MWGREGYEGTCVRVCAGAEGGLHVALHIGHGEGEVESSRYGWKGRK